MGRATPILTPILMTVALFVAGCATSVNSLSPQDIASLRIEAVDVVYAPEAAIWWGNAEREYAARLGETAPASAPRGKKAGEVPSSEDRYAALVESPEAKQYLRDKLTAMIKQRLGQDVLPKFAGARPARLEVTVHQFVIPSPAQRIVFGGNPTLGAVTVLKDGRTGAELGKLDRMAASSSGQGVLGVLVDQAFSDLEDRVIGTYTANVNAWLLKT